MIPQLIQAICASLALFIIYICKLPCDVILIGLLWVSAVANSGSVIMRTCILPKTYKRDQIRNYVEAKLGKTINWR